MKPENSAPRACYHCGEPVPPELSLSVLIGGRSEPMCCAGCQAVADTIVAYGLENFYRYRTGVSRKPEDLLPADLLRYEIYDDQQFQSGFTEAATAGRRSVHLLLEDIVCPACAWLIESRLTRLPGIVEVQVNYTSNRAAITWQEDRLTLGGILKNIHDLGYRAYPYDPVRGQFSLENERKQHLRRLGLAGLLGMQVMMFAIAIYVGDWSGMEAEYKNYFNWICLLLTTPVMVYSARPFFTRTWRDLRIFRPGMDVPVALGLTIAYGSSLWATIAGTGPVYYDSVVMFVFLLLTARYFEFMARKRATQHYDTASRIIPAVATRLEIHDGHTRQVVVPVARLQPGDRLLVKPGETISADGMIINGTSTVDESIISGESLPVQKNAGDQLIGGSTNIDSPIEMEITRIGEDTVLANILQLARVGQQDKAAITRMTNRVATWFVIAVLLLAAAVAAWWWTIDPAMAIPVTISLLVITCPCALSLATPVAVTAATSRLMSRGLVIINNNALEILNRSEPGDTFHF
ncbi:MAG: cation transporter [Gammaproteobacteria bacterium]|nr:cation transporter [Gammaproteobacteria bacterium]